METGDTSIKNERIEEVDIPQDMALLNRWTIPKIDIKTIYDYGWFDRISSKQVIKTTEKSIALNSAEQTIRLLEKRDIEHYKKHYHFMHIGMVQIAFKPLTLKGLPETFLAALRDGRNHNFRHSLIGTVESTVAYGPVYFNTQPNFQLSLSDVNILDALTLNVKFHGYDYAPGSELICLSYRIYYKLLTSLSPKCKLIDSPSNQTVLIETNFSKSKVTTRRQIRWDEIDFPQTWILNAAIAPNKVTENLTRHEFSNITQNPDGKVFLQFDDRSLVDSRHSFTHNRLMPAVHHISPIEPSYGPARSKPASLHTLDTESVSRLRNTAKYVENLSVNPKDNIVRIADNISDKDLPTASEMDFDPNPQ